MTECAEHADFVIKWDCYETAREWHILLLWNNGRKR